MKNSKTIIVLLVLIIIILGYFAFIKPAEQKDSGNPAFLKELAKNNFLMNECTLDGQKVYTTDARPVDGGLNIYNTSGTKTLSCGSGYGGNSTVAVDPSKACMQIDQKLKECKVIYSNMSGNIVDPYHLAD